MSGYVTCNCRDCFEYAIANDGDESTELCAFCLDAGCEANNGECQSPYAYGGDERDERDDDDLVIVMPECDES